MERTKEMLEARVRETPLGNRLKECQKRIGNMCAELRGPKMSIPVEYYDDDFYICTTLADAQATVEALQAQLAAAQKVKADYDRWLSGGMYFTTADYEKHVAEHQQQVEALQRERDEASSDRDDWLTSWRVLQRHNERIEAALDAEREKVRTLEHMTQEDVDTIAGLRKQLSQIQALVRAAVERWRAQINVQEGVSFRMAMKELEATLGSTAPAPDTSIVGKCEPPSQWDPNAQVRGDIS